jgi:hypothetical protein
MLMVMAQPARSGARHIQDQGGSPYCLFAVNAYLVNGDMWRLSAEYYRRELPTFDGLTPYNNDVQSLATEIYGGTIVSNAQWDTDIIRAMVKRGTPVAVSGSGHALVLISWSDSGRITYLDSLHSTAPQQMQDAQFWKWWDGWGWWVQ